MHPLCRTQSVLRFAGAAFVLALAQACPLEAQESPPETLVETKLVAAEAVNGDEFGSALAISGDVMVVAAPWADTDGVDLSGAVYVYLRDPESGAWIEHQRLMPDDRDYHSFEMTLATDGDTIVVGAPRATVSEFQDGAVHVFERDDTGIWSEVAKLSDASARVNGHFGAGIALDGDLLAIGAPQIGFDRHGFVGIFERDRGGDGAWGQVTTLHSFDRFVSAVDDQGHARSFGSAVALEGDLLVVGAARASVSYQDMRDGAAYVFRRDGSNPDQWGFAGRIIAPGADTCTGGRKLSQFLLDEWNNSEVLAEALRCAQEDISTAFDAFGETVAIQGDLLAIGAPSAEGQTEEGEAGLGVGVVHLYRQDPSGSDQWSHVAALTGSAATESSWFGQDLATDGDRVIVGARGTADNRGAAYVFEPDAGADSWAEAERLIAADGLSGARFGEAVALDGTTRLIGAGGADVARGAVYLHEPATEPPPEGPCAPSFATTAQLMGTGVATHESGVMLGAVAGTLSGPLPVWIHEVGAPAEPLFESAVTRGGYFNIGAECATFAPVDAPFVVALPVPAEAEPTDLGVAVLVAAEATPDGPSTGRFWQPLAGTYDAANQLYIVTLGALEEAGHTIVLIEHPDLGPLYFAAASPPQSGAAQSVASAPVFLVQCFGFATGCGAAEEAKLQTALLGGYVTFSEQGFTRLALDHLSATRDQSGSFAVAGSPFLYKQIYIRSSADPGCQQQGEVLGFYSPVAGAGSITICVDPATGFPNDVELGQTARHELFHAAQFAFERVRHAPRDDWVIEGTADVATESGREMHRFVERGLRSVSVRLAHEKGEGRSRYYPYQAQDFWAHLFLSTNASRLARNLGLGALAPFLEQGASTGSVAEYLASQGGETFDDLAREYWAWVKNQAVEKLDVSFDRALLYPCTIESAVVHSRSFTYPASEQIVESLGPLESELIKIVFHDSGNPAEGFDHVRVVAEGDQVKYKVYLVEDPAANTMLLEQECTQNADADEHGRSFEHLPADSIVYVLVAQTRHDEEVAPPFYRVWVDREIIPDESG